MKTAARAHPISTPHAPPAIGPYSQAVRAGELVFVSGQVALDPGGQLVAGDVAAQAERVIANLRAILEAAGCALGDVVRTTIYLVDLAHFAAVNEIYGRAFGQPYPARATVQVAALPRGAQVEIDAIAVRPAARRLTPKARGPGRRAPAAPARGRRARPARSAAPGRRRRG